MAKKLILFADGTGNSSRSMEKTNVWRIFQALDQSDPGQLCIYSDGVGTSSNRILAAIGGATGWGVKKNVLTLYKFLCRNYPNRAGQSTDPIKPEDRPEIYGFGFSRGSFTVRALIGLVDHAGLVTYGTEEELSHNAAAAYRSFRSASFKSWSPFVVISRLVRDGLIWLNNRRQGYVPFKAVQAQTKQAGRKEIEVAFLGLWDTVEAYGMPIDELKRVVDLVFWPMVFDDFKLCGIVKRARHALSLDDERATFWPIPWDERVEDKALDPPRIRQVWFAGVHSNLGGGYPEDQLSQVSLVWMMREAKAAGLEFMPGALCAYENEQSPYGKIYDSRAGLASYYRYRPRRIGTDGDANPVTPLVHHSVIERMAFGSDTYAPITLPSQFEVLRPDGATEPMTGFPPAVAPTPAGSPDAAMAQYRMARRVIGQADAETVSLMWDTVWWRRFNYFFTVAATAYLAVFPWIGGSLRDWMWAAVQYVPVLGQTLADQWRARLEANDDTLGSLLALVVDAIGGFLPAYATPWTKALVAFPLEFAFIAGLALTGFLMSSLLQTRIAGLARFAWDNTLINDYLDWIDQNNKGWRNALIMLLTASTAIAAWKYFISTDDPASVAVFSFLAILFGLWLAFQIAAVRSFEAKRQEYASSKTLPSINTLKFARCVRNCTWVTRPFDILTNGIVPVAFAVTLVAAGLWLTNRALFDGLDAGGHYCRGTVPLKEIGIEKVGTAAGELPLDHVCNATGLVLLEGHRYRIDVEVAQPWFDKSIMTDAAGFEAEGLRHIVSTPLKRRWGERWFQPIVRIGRHGNDEYPVNSKELLKSYTVAGCADEAAPAGGNGFMKMISSLNPGTVLAAVRDIPRKVSDQCVKETQAMTALPGLERRDKISIDIMARSSGELFFYVNDAVLPLLRASEFFYANNRGAATVTVKRLRD